MVRTVISMAMTQLTFAQQWTLDEAGNWPSFKQDDDGDTTWDLDQSRDSNKVNEIADIAGSTTPPWTTPAYDRAGNMTSIPQPNDLLSTYDGIYDPWNRLVKLSDGSDTVLQNLYDATHRRMIQKSYTSGTFSETRHMFYSKDWQVLEERVDSSSDPDRQFVWGLRYIDDLVFRDRTTTASLDERLYALQDANWNVTALIDSSGDPQERYRYDAYGKPRYITNIFLDVLVSSFDSDVMYASYKWLQKIKLYLVRRRLHHPAVGTWLSRDPIADKKPSPDSIGITLLSLLSQQQPSRVDLLVYLAQAVSRYQYCVSSPVINTDPSGLAALDSVTAAL